MMSCKNKSNIKRILGGLLVLTICFSGSTSAEDSRGIAVVSGTAKAHDVQQPVYRALIIGNNDYQHWNKLETAVHDAEGMYRVLTKFYGFQADNVKLLKNATRHQIKAGFEWLVNTAMADDNVLIYYAGHGYEDKAKGRGYWVPVDAPMDNTLDYIENQEVLGYLKAISARHKLLISDSCFAGDLFVNTRGPAEDHTTNRYYLEKSKKRSVQGLTSGGAEPVADGGAEGHSIFAFHLIGTLETNQKRHLAATRLGQNLTEIVTNVSNQSPIIAPINDPKNQFGEFFFIRTRNLPRAMLIQLLPQEGEAKMCAQKAGEILHGELLSLMQEMGYPMVKDRFLLATPQLNAQLPQLMQENQASIGIAYEVEAEIKPVTGKFWKGTAQVEVVLKAYHLKNQKMIKLDEFRIQPKSLYLVKWENSIEYKSAQIQRATQKLIQKWHHQKIGSYLYDLAILEGGN